MESIIVAGGTGMIGTLLCSKLTSLGYDVRILTRSPEKYDSNQYYKWDWKDKYIDSSIFPANHLVNLVGEGIADKRWTAERKKAIIDSRVKSSLFLLDSMVENQQSIGSFVSASAIGYYGDRGDQWLDEEQDAGKGFTAKCTVQWEDASSEWKSVSDQVSILRIGIVLSEKGGALGKMTMPLKVGLANYFGSGQQYYSWIHINDLCNMIIWCIKEKKNGVFNAVAPDVISNKKFATILKEVSDTPAIVAPVPAFILRLAMGELSSVLLDSTRVSSKKVIDEGFGFEFPDLQSALTDLM